MVTAFSVKAMMDQGVFRVQVIEECICVTLYARCENYYFEVLACFF